MHVKSFAKINLGIEILGKREDGFHEVRTLLQTLDLYDLLEFRVLSQDSIILEGDDETIPWDENNLIHRAAFLLKERIAVKSGIKILARKKIPPGSGLGGGSSNAASTLLALNEIWDLGLEKKTLMELAALLGTDVPFFLEGGLCLGLGKGDLITPLEDLAPLFCVLVIPLLSVSTATVYESLPSSLTSQGKDSKIIRFLDNRELSFLENELEKTVFRLHPQIKGIKNLIQEQGSELSLMSGSGSAVFGLFTERWRAEKALKTIGKDHPVVLAKTISRTEGWKQWRAGV
jgi:4-diphosphocytidyl-2-C-methyl-D-erythritol kinase